MSSRRSDTVTNCCLLLSPRQQSCRVSSVPSGCVLKLTMGKKAFEVMVTGEKNEEFRLLEIVDAQGNVAPKNGNRSRLFTGVESKTVKNVCVGGYVHQSYCMAGRGRRRK